MEESNPFIGTWKLISWEVKQPDGTIHYLYGKNVVGYLIYTAGGYMSSEIMDPDRQQSDPNFPLEIAAAQTLPDPDRARATALVLWLMSVRKDRVSSGVRESSSLSPNWAFSLERIDW